MMPKVSWNPSGFATGFVKRKARRMVIDFVEGLNRDGRGVERARKMIRESLYIHSLVRPELLQQYLELAKQYSWASSMISDNDIKGWLPAWVTDAVNSEGLNGQQWLQTQIGWLRSIFSP